MQALNNDHLHELRQAKSDFERLMSRLTDEEFTRLIPEKWTAGQHIQHLFTTTQPVVMALGLPRFLLKWIFGKANRPSDSYENLTARYRAKIGPGGAKSPKAFVPKPIPLSDRTKVEGYFTGSTDQLLAKAERWEEADLDNILLPHPLLGKITVREMLYFCAFHIRVHQAAVERDLGSDK